MNTKRFLVITAVVALSVSLFALIATTKSTPAKAQIQAEASRLILVNEPMVRMQSGAIQFTDSNHPDFNPHAKVFLKQRTTSDCMSDENNTPRRQSGCIQ